MSDNASNNINMGNYHNGTVPATPIAQNIQEQSADNSHQSSIPRTAGMHVQNIHHQGQDINMAPPSYLDDPFNPIHYQHLAHIKTLEDVFDDYPVDFQSPLNFEYAGHPAVRNIFNPINTIGNLQGAIDAAAARRNAMYCLTHLGNRPGKDTILEIYRRKALGYGTCSTDFAWMPKETGKRCDRCVEMKRNRMENRAAAAAAAQPAQQSQEDGADTSQATSTDDSMMSGEAIANLHI
ncbi:uncharacterized protein B0T23DRAFT_404040 [Neurospora hispaniola]|uniref:Uncharacterized protein n=1 Tax=Neurospora hispaniola TaxID=588809 RepID=A0AAJ0IB22_9PEZI|nr:hypothetical protein B0T23DRAFT_404040 [Neurospora hispaniola]